MASCNKLNEQSNINKIDQQNNNTCSTNSTNLETESYVSNTETSFPNEISYEPVDLDYDFYCILCYENTFLSTMKNSIIDKKVEKFFEDAMTTVDMTEAAMKSYELWKDEMQYAIDELTKDLTKEHQELFLEAQEKWEEYVIKNMICDKQIITGYGNYGTELQFKFPMARAELYRERTLKIKYLHFMLETDLDKLESEFKSLTFKNGQ